MSKPPKLPMAELSRRQRNAAHHVPEGSFWRHRNGDVYEVVGHSIRAGDAEPLIHYSLAVSDELILHRIEEYYPREVVFSRPYTEWMETVDGGQRYVAVRKTNAWKDI